MLQHLADGRVDLVMGRGNTGPVYPWFGQDIRQGLNLAVENYALLRRLGAASGPSCCSTSASPGCWRTPRYPPPRGRA
jgi:alkanesulfonate monooxygenase SsuD/methylene tetrahydromethanopterin reductase-like flavin-dependent oxidoreductase (luciferase family)